VGEVPRFDCAMPDVMSLVKQLQLMSLDHYLVFLPNLLTSLKNTEMRPLIKAVSTDKLLFD